MHSRNRFDKGVRMDCLKIVFLLAIVTLLPGCSAESMDDFNRAMLGNSYVPPGGGSTASAPDSSGGGGGENNDYQSIVNNAVDGWGMAFSEAKSDEVTLQQGMTSLQVLGLLHRADSTSTINCQPNTPQAWTGICWTYSFLSNGQGAPVANINLVFNTDNNGILHLNNWSMFPE